MIRTYTAKVGFIYLRVVAIPVNPSLPVDNRTESETGIVCAPIEDFSKTGPQACLSGNLKALNAALHKYFTIFNLAIKFLKADNNQTIFADEPFVHFSAPFDEKT
jgi:hypothetical protein